MTRKWFQIHLSTAVILVLVAGGLLYVNLSPAHRQGSPLDWPLYADDDDWYYEANDCGWPWILHSDFIAKYPAGTSTLAQWNHSNLFLNSLTALVLLIICAGSSEYLIRRRESLKP
jgi:hypothetical protein